MSGFLTFVKGNGNDWFLSGMTFRANLATSYAAGLVPLGAALTQIKIRSEDGANTFDNGTAYIAYR